MSTNSAARRSSERAAHTTRSIQTHAPALARTRGGGQRSTTRRTHRAPILPRGRNPHPDAEPRRCARVAPVAIRDDRPSRGTARAFIIEPRALDWRRTGLKKKKKKRTPPSTDRMTMFLRQLRSTRFIRVALQMRAQHTTWFFVNSRGRCRQRRLSITSPNNTVVQGTSLLC